MKHVSSAYGKTVDHGNDRLGQGPYLFLHVKHIETRHSVCADIAAFAFYVHVTSRAEGLCLEVVFFCHAALAWGIGSCEDNYTYVLCFAAMCEGF